MINKLVEKLKGKLIQTHTSWVILLDDIVYKIKKPVNFGFLDYSTLEKRKLFCEREVELNRRLCSYIYLGVVPISMVNGDPQIENSSNVVEYAVKMRRIDDKNLLINRLNDIKDEEIRSIARKIACFHKNARKTPEYGRIEVMKFNTDENFEQVKPFIGKTISAEDYEYIKEKTNSFYERYSYLFNKRISEGKIVDGHGDIRLEHVAFLDEGICIFDCIEFNERFRCGDMVNDMCFLSMELEFMDRRDLAKVYEETYFGETKDEEFYTVLPFFKTYRAFVRGKVYSFMLNDPHIKGEEKEMALKKAKGFFSLSREYAVEIS